MSLGCIGNCFFQEIQKLQERENPEKQSYLEKKKITLGKPETELRFCSNNTKASHAQVLIHIHIHTPGVDEVRMPGATVLISTK